MFVNHPSLKDWDGFFISQNPYLFPKTAFLYQKWVERFIFRVAAALARVAATFAGGR